MKNIIKCYFPEPKKNTTKILPVFLPFAGCPFKCIYCNQRIQTGVSLSFDKAYNSLKSSLERLREKKDPPREVAFFGGTFTGLDKKIIKKFLMLVGEYKKKGVISQVRCSTRPDFINEELLLYIKKLGMDIVELGIQSFDEKVLNLSKRGYSSEIAKAASYLVKKLGLVLGIQLLPGLPGFSKEIWDRDIKDTISIGPDFVRIYPCIVLKGTVLEKKFKENQYLPLDLTRTVRLVAKGVLKLWRSNIPVIRMGLHSEPSILKNMVAGPYHPAFGTMVRSYILHKWLFVITGEKDGEIEKILVPQKYQGEFFGIKGGLRDKYKKIGINREKIGFHNKNYFAIIKTKQKEHISNELAP